MASRRSKEPKSEVADSVSSAPPAKSPMARERQLIALAVDRVEQRIRNGTATSQELVHYLKLGSSREMLEQERLARENELLEAKAEAAKSAQKTEELYLEALSAMRSYSGQAPLPPPNEYDD